LHVSNNIHGAQKQQPQCAAAVLKNLLAARLCPDPPRGAERFPDPIDAAEEGWERERLCKWEMGKEVRGKEENGIIHLYC